MLLIDSSAIVKFFSKEPGWEGIEQHIASAVTIPPALVEVGSALLKKLAEREISRQIAAEILTEYSRTAILVNQNKYVPEAFKIAAENGTSIYDSLFIAVAVEEGYELVSCDKKQLKTASKLGIKTIRC